MKDLNKYLKKRSKNIESLLLTPRLNCTPEIFHDLRVEIKKLRSLFSLLKFAVGFNQKKMDKPFRKVFKQAGRVREIHVEEEMLQRYFSIDFLIDYRKKIKAHKSEEVRKYIVLVNDQAGKINKVFSSIKPLISLVNKKVTEEFVDKRRKRMMQLLDQDHINPPQVHLLRKRIKQYYYALRFTKAVNQKKIVFVSDSLTELLGKWHDGQMLIYHLERQMHNPGIQINELEQIAKVRNEQLTVNGLTFSQIKGILGEIKENQPKS